MKSFYLIFTFIWLFSFSATAQISASFSKNTTLKKIYQPDSSSKNANPKKINSSLKRTTKIIPEEKKEAFTNKKSKKTSKTSKRKSKAIIDDDIPF